MTEHRRNIVVLLGLAALLFLTNLGGYDLWPADEPRYAQVAREMMQSGDYLAPHVNGLPYKEKPPLLFWAIAIASWPFGDVTEFSARLPSVLGALATVLCTYALATRLYGHRVAFWAGLILITGTRFWWQARTAQIDMMLTACLTAGLLCFRVWQENKRTRWLVAFYGAITLAVYAKGPPGVIFPLLMLFAFYFRRRSERRQTHWLLGALAVAALIALWLVPARLAVAGATAQTPETQIASNLFHQTIGRFFLGVSKAQPPWYYVGTLAADLLPWTLFLPWTLPWVWRHRRQGPEMRLLLSWTVPALVFFSICSGKRAVYLLPLFPVFAVLIARSVLDFMQSDHVLWRTRTAAGWGLLLLGIGLAPFGLLLSPYGDAWYSGLAIFSLCALGFAGDTFRRALKTESRALHVTMVCHFAGLVLMAVLFVFPVVNQFKSARPFCAPLRALSEAGETYRLYSLGFSREEFIFYTEHFHEAVPTDFVPPPDTAEIDVKAVTQAYKQLRKTAQDAVDAVDVRTLEAPTEAEFQALRSAFDAALEAAHVAPPLAAAYEAGLRERLHDFAARFETPGAAFTFVRQDAWRRYMALYPHPPRYHLVRQRRVGSRHVLLLANTGGALLLAQSNRFRRGPL